MVWLWTWLTAAERRHGHTKYRSVKHTRSLCVQLWNGLWAYNHLEDVCIKKNARSICAQLYHCPAAVDRSCDGSINNGRPLCVQLYYGLGAVDQSENTIIKSDRSFRVQIYYRPRADRKPLQTTKRIICQEYQPRVSIANNINQEYQLPRIFFSPVSKQFLCDSPLLINNRTALEKLYKRCRTATLWTMCYTTNPIQYTKLKQFLPPVFYLYFKLWIVNVTHYPLYIYVTVT